MKEFRSKSCHKLLAKIVKAIPVNTKVEHSWERGERIKENSPIKPSTQRQEDTVIHIKCPKCGTMNSRVKEIQVIIEV